MIRNLGILLRYILFWLLVFVMGRTVFILFNLHEAGQLPLGEVLAAYYHGFMLDVSMTGYIMAVPAFLWLIAHFSNNKAAVNRGLKIYQVIMLSIVILISTADAELYRFWGQKLNMYASSFARFPKQMMASSAGSSLVKIVIAIGLQYFIAWFVYRKWIKGLDEVQELKRKPVLLPVFVVIAGLIFLGIRGGWGKAAINQSAAYYSPQLFLNHAAVNASWNLLAGMVETNDATNKNPYVFTGNAEAHALVDSLYDASCSSFPQLIRDQQANVLLIILEGWGADVIEPLGGETGITPQFNALAQQGLLFTNAYASGNRTDKGIAAVISAQPSLAKSSIINKIEKFSNLPSLCRSFTAKGYHSEFIYGGESIFANMKGFWLNAGYQRIVDLNDFPLKERVADWGVHDDALFAKVLEELNGMPQPFFASTLTLSSHEPFRVPVTAIAGDDDAQRYRNAAHFSDACLGAFLQKAAAQPWYANTLVVIVADHGHQWPKDRKSYDPQRFHIPLLFTGGALRPEWRGRTISKTGSQMDIAATVLQQFGMDSKAFNWSKNLADTCTKSFATFVYNDGIGLVQYGRQLVFDQETKQVIWNAAEANDSLSQQMQRTARAVEQVYYDEYLTR